MTQAAPFTFDNSYQRELDGCYLPWRGANAPDPRVLRVNAPLAGALGLRPDALTTRTAARWLTGSHMPAGAASICMAYAGHQFGGFSPQLGDGRALLLGEVFDMRGRRRDIHLKGSGPTPFSRGGDGRAVLGPVLREYLVGEAMHALGVPTTRALAACLTGEQVARDGPRKGAVLARVAASHLRVGTFQFFAARGDVEKLRRLADYAIARHYPDLAGRDDACVALFARVCDAQARLVAKWMALGFTHGVMNTDNMTISGETIDYGPCAFLDGYDPQTVFSSIDRTGRYAFGAQPDIAGWNLARFAETLIPLVPAEDPDDAIRRLSAELNGYPALYRAHWLGEMRARLGLRRAEEGDQELAASLLRAMEGRAVDFTGLFRALSDVARGDATAARAQFDAPQAFDAWRDVYVARLGREADAPDEIARRMDRANPIYIPRNHLVEEALQAAEQDDLAPFDALLERVTHPFDPRPGDRYAAPAPPEFGRYTTFCGT